MESTEDQQQQLWDQVVNVMTQPVLGPIKLWHMLLFMAVQVFKIFTSKDAGGQKKSASHILVADEKLADEIKAKLDKDPSQFGTLAEKHSTCPSGKNGGSLGSFSKGAMVPEFDQVCFDPNTVPDQIYKVKTQFGWHLLKVVGVMYQ